MEHKRAALTTATVTGAHAVHAFPRSHLSNDDVSALLKAVPNASGIVEGDGCIVSGSSGDRRDGKIVAIDEDRVSISAQGGW